MAAFNLDRRTLVRALVALGGMGMLPGEALATGDKRPESDPHTRVTFMAAVESVLPPTPDLKGRHGSPLGPEHEPGGIAVGLHDAFIRYLDDGFSAALPRSGPVGNARLSETVANTLDAGATELVIRGGNEHPPAGRRVRELLKAADLEGAVLAAAAGPFARLHRADRLRALALFDEDEKEFDTAGLPGPLVEGDAGIVPTLVVGFAELIYYSEWGGYVDGRGLHAPPNERAHTNNPKAVQSWRQTDYPGFSPGYAALRGYAGRPDSPLGEGHVWKTIAVREGDDKGEEGHGERRSGSWKDGVHIEITVGTVPDRGGDDREGPLQITLESGAFRDNDYTDEPGYKNYEEVFREDGTYVGGADGEVS